MRYFFFKTFTKKCLIAGLPALLVLNTLPVFARDVTDRFRDELWYLDRLSVPAAWDLETGSESTIVAVLDAGFDLNHEDLTNQYWRNVDEIAADGSDNDHNGYEDDVMGWDFVDNDPDPSPDVEDGASDIVASHGTVIAGIIGATANNGLGIAGINWDISIMPLRVLNEFGAGTTRDVDRAIHYAVENGADVINLSFTFTQTDSRLRDTIQWAHEQGVVIVAAIGNGDIDTDARPVYPACFDREIGHNIVIGVTATNKNDQKASFSNFGTNCVDIAAPGTDIFASVYYDADSFAFVTSYASPWEGTSLAAPMISAGAALIRSSYPSLTPDQIRDVLKLSVDPVAETSLEARKRLGAGRANFARALEYASVFAGNGRHVSSNSLLKISNSFVAAQGPNGAPTVRRVNGNGDVLTQFDAYNSDFRGGVRIAVGDVDGDGKEEIVTGAGPGGGPQVRIFDLNGSVKGQFFAFDKGDRLGINIAVGDVNGDGVDEILVASDQGGTGQVRIFNRYGYLKGAFFPMGRTDAGLRLATGNFDDDNADEIISTAIAENDARLMIHDGTGKYLHSFTTENAGSVSIASADFDGDGKSEIIVGSGHGRLPKVFVYNGLGTLLQSFFAFPIEYQQGINVAAGDIDGNGTSEIYVSSRAGGGPQVRIFDDKADVIGGFFSFDPLSRLGLSVGIY